MNNTTKRGIAVLDKIINQQIDYLNGFELKTEIPSEKSGDSVRYKIVKDLWDSLPKLLTALNELRIGSDEEKNEFQDVVPISPQSIAKTKIGR